MSEKLKVGDTIYMFDQNRRARDANGNVDYRGKFWSVTIVDETKQSWIVPNGFRTIRVNKATMKSAGGAYGDTFWFTAESMEEDIWRTENRHRIVREIERADTATLRLVDELLVKRAPGSVKSDIK